MKLEDILQHKRRAIQKQWLETVLKTYPEDGRRFFRAQKDPFANPVGFTMSKEIENLFGALLQGSDNEALLPVLDRIIRIRAVQEFSPSQAVGFVFALKRIVSEACAGELQTGVLSQELARFLERIDEVGLFAFDVYMKCREHLFGVRVHEVKNQAARLLQRAGMVYEDPVEGPDSREGNVT